MTTPLAIISRSLRLLGVYAAGEVPTGDEATDALTAFNSLVQSFGNESLLIFAASSQEITFAANQASVTVGPTGTTVSARPVRVLSTSYVLVDGMSYPLDMLTDAEYSGIALKDQAGGIPSSIFVDNSMPDSRIYLYPIPSQDVTLVLLSNSRLGTFELTDQLVLPDGYDRMLAYCLAAEIAPEYGLKASPDILRAAGGAKRAIKRANAQIPRLGMPSGIPSGNFGGAVSGGRGGAYAITTTDGDFFVYTP